MSSVVPAAKDEEELKRNKRKALKALNEEPYNDGGKALDSSIKKHQALTKRLKSIGYDTRDQTLKDIETLVLAKYVDEIVPATIEGLSRCKTEKDVWSAVEIISALHRRFPDTFTRPLIAQIATGLVPPSKAALAALPPEQREKEESARIVRQRPLIRVAAELALVGILKDVSGRNGGEWIMKTLKDLLSNDPSLTSLPLLSTFLKSYSRPFLGITGPSPAKQQASSDATGADNAETQSPEQVIINEDDELVEKDVRDKFRRMCEGYYETVSKKLVKEHERLKEQDRRNHDAYVRSGEIFEDRQQAYEKMAKSYEKLQTSCQTLSELLYLPMPDLKAASKKSDSILLLDGSNSRGEGQEETFVGNKWEDEEERRFYEDLTDLKDFVPKSFLGIEGDNDKTNGNNNPANAESEKQAQADSAKEVEKLEAEIKSLTLNGSIPTSSASADNEDEEDEEDVTPVPTPPRTPSPGPAIGPGPSQMLTTLLAKLPDATNRELIDQAAVDFCSLNSKAARKRLVKFLGQIPKNRLDLLPYYSRLVATLNKYMPDIGTDLVAILEDEFRYLQRKKGIVKELAEVRRKNITFISALTKFSVVPQHLILHIFKVFIDDFSGANIDNIAMLLEGCGRFLLRNEETSAKMNAMLELMRRKQSLTHLDPRQVLVLENAYYQCNPPERAPRQEKQRSPVVLFARHLIYDVLAKKTIDKVLKLLRKLDWENKDVVTALHKAFTKPWKVKYNNVSLLAMLTYDLQRYHSAFSIGVVDQVLEDIRRGVEQNVYANNQRRVATMKYLGELYIYRLIGSSLIFNILWSLVTFGYPDGRPLPGQVSPLDAPDDFFRVRLVCVLLDSCGMCFDRGSLKKRLDTFLVYFQYYILCKDPLPMEVDFMLTDTLEALRHDLKRFKTVEEAATAVDEMLLSVGQVIEGDGGDGEDSDGGDDSDEAARVGEPDEEEDLITENDTTNDRPASPDAVVLLSNSQENHGPSKEDEEDFEKELAKMILDSSVEARKVDKKAALAMWDSAVIPGGRKRRDEAENVNGVDGHNGENVMKFTVISRKGNKQQMKQLAVPGDSALAVQTRSAQLQDKVEQQELKRLVLDYEQREEQEETKSNVEILRNKGAKARYTKDA
ncbi:hypothetical protein FRC03_012156 [Tulasnella sp. 419]|nr:hypothetical protein FRC03_012156 [Tulasnella sp. 419]